MAETNGLATLNDLHELERRLLARLNVSTGPGLFSQYGPGGVQLALSTAVLKSLDDQASTDDLEGKLPGIRAIWVGKITVATSLGSNQWQYTVWPMHKSNSMTGYNVGSWSHTPLYREITPGQGLQKFEEFTAYNLCEVGNSDVGIQGNGVDLANLPAGFAIQPVPVGCYILCVEYTDEEVWFCVPNGIDGECA